MSHIEYRPATDQYYFIKRITLLSQSYIIRKYIGNKSISKEKYLLDNLDSLSKQEFDWRKKHLPVSFIYSADLLKKNELLAIRTANLIEGKKCEKEVFVEFAKEFIFNSNNIEGSRIPIQKVRDVVERGDTQYANRQEVLEVKNSLEAFEFLQSSFRFNVSSIKRLYHILVKGLYRQGNHPYPKGFKKEENVVANSQTTAPELVEKEIIQLLDWYKQNKKIVHPVVLAFEFHRRFEKIHPFVDGNGRTGRLLMNKLLMSGRYPPIIVFTKNKDAYFHAFTGNKKKMYHFLIEQSVKSYEFLNQTAQKY